jgi:hypothetical protein
VSTKPARKGKGGQKSTRSMSVRKTRSYR